MRLITVGIVRECGILVGTADVILVGIPVGGQTDPTFVTLQMTPTFVISSLTQITNDHSLYLLLTLGTQRYLQCHPWPRSLSIAHGINTTMMPIDLQIGQ